LPLALALPLVLLVLVLVVEVVEVVVAEEVLVLVLCNPVPVLPLLGGAWALTIPSTRKLRSGNRTTCWSFFNRPGARTHARTRTRQTVQHHVM
jgi:hypothetical protein